MYESFFDLLRETIQGDGKEAITKVTGVSNQEELLEAIAHIIFGIETQKEIVIANDFSLSKMITIPEGVSLRGVGNPKIQAPTDAGTALQLLGDNKISNFTIHGDHTTRAVLVNRKGNIVIRDMVFDKMGADKTNYSAVYIRNGDSGNEIVIENVTIQDCVFKNSASHAMVLWRMKRGKVVNNIIDGTTGEHKHRGNGIRAEDLDTCIISGNTFTNIGRMGAEVLGGGTTCTTISNNTFDTYGLNEVGGVKFAISVGQLANNVVINGNVAKNAPKGFGYEIAQDATNIILSNNIAKNVGQALSVSAGCHNLTIHGNIWDGSSNKYQAQLFQCWSIDYSNNLSINHTFPIGDGNKRGLLVNQCNKVNVRGNTFEGDYNSSPDAAIYFYSHLSKDNPRSYGTWDEGGKISANAHSVDNNVLRGGGTRLVTLHGIELAPDSNSSNLVVK